MNTSGCREGIEETPSVIEETPRGINGKTTVFWIGIIAGPKAQGRHWKKLYLLHVGNTFLDVKGPRTKIGRLHSFGLKITSPKVQGRHICENYTLCTCSTVGKSSTQIQVKAPGKTILALACKKCGPKIQGKSLGNGLWLQKM